MAVFLQELSKRLAEKWLTLLALPGLLLVATAATGIALGHRHWADVRRLVGHAARLAADLTAAGPVANGLAVFGVLLASTCAGLVAVACGRLVQGWWVGTWPGWLRRLRRRLTAARNGRWRRVQDDIDAATRRGDLVADQRRHLLDQLAARSNRIALAEPSRPTWIGDRVAAVDARVFAAYKLDLASAWPRLWLLVPDTVRVELQAAVVGFDKAATLGGWALLYLLVGGVWWPAAVAGLLVGVVAWHRGRVTIGALADLAEAMVDLYGANLAEALGLSQDPELTEAVGQRITARLRKGS